MSYVQNDRELLSHGDVEGRRRVLHIVERALESVDPYLRAREAVRYHDGVLDVGGYRFDPGEIRDIYVIGAGKGSFSIVQALEEVLGPRIRAGAVVVKEGDHRRLKNMRVIEAGHPVPNRMSIAGARALVEVAGMAGQGDLVLTAFTGGCSALVELPAEGIGLDDLVRMNDLLLGSGAVIQEMNAVRKHVSTIKGGLLVQNHIRPARMVSLTLDTSPEGMPWPDLSYPDPSTFDDALEVIHQYGLADHMPPPVMRRLAEGAGNPAMETPKDFGEYEIRVVGLANQITACEAGAAAAEELGLQGVILGAQIEGEASEVGIAMTGIAKEVHLRNRPFLSPCALISGGETTVTLREGAGTGGPNQEMSLSVARKIGGFDGIVCACLDTDGTDGPTGIAGGMVDACTAARARSLGMDLRDVVRRHDASPALERLGDAVITGHTGTNVMNLRVILIEPGS